MKELIITRRVTTTFLQAIPPQVEYFDAYIYAVVKRQIGKDIIDEKYGIDVRLDPCVLDWSKKTITMRLPFNINVGIKDFNDLDSNFFESVQAAFLALIYSCMP